MCNFEKYQAQIKSLNETVAFATCCCVGWRKLFEQIQDVLREVRKKELLPDELYLKAVRLCEISELPKKYYKKEQL